MLGIAPDNCDQRASRIDQCGNKPGKRLSLSALAMLVCAASLLVGNTALAESKKNDRAVRLLDTVRIPPVLPAANSTAGAMYSFDISWVDQATRTYYLADR